MKRIILMLIAAAAVIASCGTPDEAPVAGNGTLVLEADKLEMVADGEDAVLLTVKYDGTAVGAEDVNFYDASTNVPVRVSGMRFITKTVGVHSIYAIYNNAKSNTVKITALEFAVPDVPADPNPDGKSFKKRVLLTQFTSTGCTYCPTATKVLRDLAADPQYQDKFVLGASHADMPNYQNGDDPAEFSGATSFMRAFGVGGFPTLIMELDEQANVFNAVQVKSLLDEYYGDGTSVAGISVNSELNGNVVVLRAAVKVGKGGKYRIGAWLLESGIYGKQTSAPDESYNIHDNCIRLIDAESHYMGHDLGMIASGSSAERVFTLKIDSGWKTENCKVLLYVTSASGVNQVINNAVIVPIGEAVAYEY